MSKKTAFRRLFAAALWSTFGAALAFAALNWGLPWLGRRGNLNAIVEGILRSSLTVPITIEKIDSEPLNQLTVTKLHLVNAKATNRFHFGAQSISIQYDPVEIFSGRIRSTVFEAPAIFINLDADLAGITKMPELETSRPPPTTPPLASDDPLLPFSIDEVRVESGTLTLQLNERQLELANLRVALNNVGRLQGQGFLLSVQALGGVVRAWGRMDIERRAGEATRYTFREAHVAMAGLDAARLLAWIVPTSTEASWLRPLLESAKGTLGLEGSVDGTWPEHVTVSLATHASDFSTALNDKVGVHQGSLGLHVNAEVLGDLEVVKLSISTHGEGSFEPSGADIERGQIEINASLDRSSGSGELIVAPSRIVLENAGEIAIAGSVDSIFGDAPLLDLAIEAIALDGGALWTRVPLPVKQSLLEATSELDVRGRLNAKTRLSGPLTRPRIDGDLEIVDAAIATGGKPAMSGALWGNVEGLEFDAARSIWSVARIRAESSPLDANALAPALGLDGVAFSAGGKLAIHLEADEQCFPASSSGWDGRIEVKAEAGACSVAHTGIDIAGVDGAVLADVAFFPAARRLLARWSGVATTGEVLIGNVYAPFKDKPVTIEGQAVVTWGRDGRLDTLSLEDVTCFTPFTGPITATAKLLRSSGGDGLLLEAAVEATRIPAREAFAVFVAEPLASAAPFLTDGTLTGDASLTLRLDGNAQQPSAWGQLTLNRGELYLTNVEARGLSLELPFEAGDPLATASESAGFIAVDSLHVGGARFGPMRLELRLVNGAYVTEPISFPAYGGKVDVGAATLAPRSAAGVSAEVDVKLRGLDTRRLSQAHGTKRIKGLIDADLRPLRLRASRLESLGTVQLRAFGGEISFKDLVLDNVEKPYADLRLGEGRVKSLRLDQVGAAFHFGLMSGVLDGSITNLQLTGGELSRFEIDLGTVPTRGVPQYLDRAAIESIRRILTGPLGAIEETFFSRFRFSDFGFVASLDDGLFRLRGKYQEGGKEYVMRARWYQLPQVNIINGRPDQAYDWRTIIENLRRLTERKQDS